MRQIYETHVESACLDVFLNCVISSSSCLNENLWDIKLTKWKIMETRVEKIEESLKVFLGWKDDEYKMKWG